ARGWWAPSTRESWQPGRPGPVSVPATAVKTSGTLFGGAPATGVPHGLNRCWGIGSSCYNRSIPFAWRYRLGVRTEDSQSSNPGSIPGSATKPLLLSRIPIDTYTPPSRVPKTGRNALCGTVAAETGHNLGHSPFDMMGG